jgi:hypothetical protein
MPKPISKRTITCPTPQIAQRFPNISLKNLYFKGQRIKCTEEAI